MKGGDHEGLSGRPPDFSSEGIQVLAGGVGTVPATEKGSRFFVRDELRGESQNLLKDRESSLRSDRGELLPAN
jgi:hypothetical protein